MSTQLSVVEPFEWPGERSFSALRSNWQDAYRAVFLKTAATIDFAKWLDEIDENDGLSWKRLWVLYEEFCAMEGLAPLKPGALQRSFRAAGVETERPRITTPCGRRKRTTVYTTRAAIFARSPHVLKAA